MGRIKNNDGFSLIELIVAVLIMGIISTMAIVGFSNVYNAKVENAAKLNGSTLKRARQDAMALMNVDSDENPVEVFSFIYMKDGNYYNDIYQLEHNYTTTGGVINDSPVYTKLLSEKLCNKNVKLVFFNHERPAETYTMVDETMGVKVFFKKGTGAISKICYASAYNNLAAGGMVAEHTEGGVTTFCDTITFKGASESKNLILISATGRCYLDNN